MSREVVGHGLRDIHSAVAAGPASSLRSGQLDHESGLHTRVYLHRLLHRGLTAAAMKPAGRSLARAHCRHIDPARPQVIVEIGAGTGAVTQTVAACMHPESRLIAIEIDEDFATILRRRCPQATVLAADARDLADQLAGLRVERIDLMISCIGPRIVPRAVNEAMFACLARLGRHAWFTQQTIVPLAYQQMYRRLFEQVQFRLVLANLPPGGVYHCRQLKPDYRRHLPGKA